MEQVSIFLFIFLLFWNMFLYVSFELFSIFFLAFFVTKFHLWLQAISVEVLPLNGESLMVEKPANSRYVLIIY